MNEDLRVAVLMMLAGGVRSTVIAEVLDIGLDEVKHSAAKPSLRPTSIRASAGFSPTSSDQV